MTGLTHTQNPETEDTKRIDALRLEADGQLTTLYEPHAAPAPTELVSWEEKFVALGGRHKDYHYFSLEGEGEWPPARNVTALTCVYAVTSESAAQPNIAALKTNTAGKGKNDKRPIELSSLLNRSDNISEAYLFDALSLNAFASRALLAARHPRYRGTYKGGRLEKHPLTTLLGGIVSVNGVEDKKVEGIFYGNYVVEAAKRTFNSVQHARDAAFRAYRQPSEEVRALFPHVVKQAKNKETYNVFAHNVAQLAIINSLSITVDQSL